MNTTTIWQWLLACLMTAAPLIAVADATNSPASSTGEILLLDNLGRVVRVSTNQLPANLQPPADVGVAGQIPNPTEGASTPPEILQRSRAVTNGFQFFPSVPPSLGSYLASQNEYGNTAIRPGALFFFVPLEAPVQGGKYWLSEYGFRYSLQQTLTSVNMSGLMKGQSDLKYYTLDFKSKWNLYDAPAAGNAGWISAQIEDKTAVDSASDTQSAKSNLGTVTDPTGIWSSVSGLRVPELAWQQSLRGGDIVVVAGMISQRNYFDGNAYAGTGRGKFLNSALIHSQVLPLAQNNFGLNLQWQPLDEWYYMIGGSIGASPAGNSPWTGFAGNSWSLIGEFGYAPRNFLGFGPGVYRLQPFLAQATGEMNTTYNVTLPGSATPVDVSVNSMTNSPVQAGLCLDCQQQLGANTPLGWFGRFGFGGSSVGGGTDVQAGSGIVFQGPLKHLLFQKTSNDFLGVGFVWSEPSATSKTIYHDNEYILETVYTLQLTPTIKVQPDFQMIWDPAYHQDASRATVFQIQLVLAW